jgi:hypothetical protein
MGKENPLAWTASQNCPVFGRFAKKPHTPPPRMTCGKSDDFISRVVNFPAEIFRATGEFILKGSFEAKPFPGEISGHLATN